MSKNYLLGKAERLAITTKIGKQGFGPKKYPYSFAEAKERLIPMLQKSNKYIYSLDDEACPQNYTSAIFTLHPAFIARSYFPNDFFNQLGLKSYGSRIVTINVDTGTSRIAGKNNSTAELLISGKKESFADALDVINDFVEEEDSPILMLRHFELIKPFSLIEKSSITDNRIDTFEIILNYPEDITNTVRDAFNEYCNFKNINIVSKFKRGALTFLKLEMDFKYIEYISKFSFVRRIRPVPTIRSFKPIEAKFRSINTSVNVSKIEATENELNVAILDGGVNKTSCLNSLINNYSENDTLPDGLEHGSSVASAFLFGNIKNSQLTAPYAKPDCYSVVTKSNINDIYETLKYIKTVLSNKQYDLINLSIGPNITVSDNDIHIWTVFFDKYLRNGKSLLTIAVGNDGEEDAKYGLNRIQVPSDSVNALAVGAVDSESNKWDKTSYSCVGPGRYPGFVKPDIVAFGGCSKESYNVLNDDGISINQVAGTSFAAPHILRYAAYIKSTLNQDIDMLATKALIINKAELPKKANLLDIGRGRVNFNNLEDLLHTPDNTATVIYQGNLTPKKFNRMFIPIPDETIDGEVEITATLCFTSDVDPADTFYYTKSGVDINFRPHSKKGIGANGHPKKDDFFKEENKFLNENELKKDGGKWETTLHAKKTKRGSSLFEPCFDIRYHERINGMTQNSQQSIPYALVVTIHSKKMPNLYNKIVSKYKNKLQQLKPQLRAEIKTKL